MRLEIRADSAFNVAVSVLPAASLSGLIVELARDMGKREEVGEI